MLESIDRAIGRLAAVCGCVGLLVLPILIVLQIGARRQLFPLLLWTDEITRFAMIWICFLGALIAFRESAHFRVGFVMERLSSRPAFAINIAAKLIVLLLIVILAWYGIKVDITQWSQRAVTFGMSLGWVYIALPITAVGMLPALALEIYRILTGQDSGNDRSVAESQLRYED